MAYVGPTVEYSSPSSTVPPDVRVEPHRNVDGIYGRWKYGTLHGSGVSNLGYSRWPTSWPAHEALRLVRIVILYVYGDLLDSAVAASLLFDWLRCRRPDGAMLLPLCWSASTPAMAPHYQSRGHCAATAYLLQIW